jgi:hypothetical protein
MKKIEIEVLNQKDLKEFPECDGMTWACVVTVDGREPVILTSDGLTERH